MSNKKQTAVGCLIKEIEELQKNYIDLAKKDKSFKKGVDAILTATTLLKMKCNQAKEMEKQQIIEADVNGSIRTAKAIDYRITQLRIKELAEQYYKETFNKD
jgi:heme oxygenase